MNNSHNYYFERFRCLSNFKICLLSLNSLLNKKK